MKRIALLISLLIIIIFSGCMVNDNSPKKITTDFLNTYYNVDDYNMYKRVFFDEVIKGNPKKEEERILSFFDKYKKHLYEDNFSEQFLGNRVLFYLLKDCYDNKYTLKVNDIELKKTSEDSNTIVYRYTVNLRKITENKIKSSITEYGQIQAYRYEDSWRLKFFPD